MYSSSPCETPFSFTHFLSISIAIITALVLFCAPANAQNQISEEEAFEAVFNDPGNVLLNFTLVAAQIRNGNFKEAAGTLERILILLPDEPRAQMLLATVQLALGNAPEAGRLARKVEANPKASRAQLDEARAMLDRLAEEEKLFDFAGSLAFGAGLADNPAGGSTNNNAQPKVGGAYGTNSKRATTEEFSTATLSINLSRNLEAQTPRSVTVGASLHMRDYANYQDGDMTTVNTSIQYNHSTRKGRYNASAGVASTNIGDQPYQNSYQFRLAYDHLFDNGVTASVAASAARKVFKKFDSETNTQKTGNSHTVSSSFGRIIGSTRFVADFSVGDVNAQQARYGKSTYNAGLSATTLILPGMTTARLGVVRDAYRGADTTLTSPNFYRREDTTNSLRVTHLLGLRSFNQPSGDEPYVNFTGTYSKTKSNIVNYTKYAGEFSITVSQPF